jgi:hypothetical protein
MMVRSPLFVPQEVRTSAVETQVINYAITAGNYLGDALAGIAMILIAYHQKVAAVVATIRHLF